jgi:hypothetical protein
MFLFLTSRVERITQTLRPRLLYFVLFVLFAVNQITLRTIQNPSLKTLGSLRRR